MCSVAFIVFLAGRIETGSLDLASQSALAALPGSVDPHLAGVGLAALGLALVLFVLRRTKLRRLSKRLRLMEVWDHDGPGQLSPEYHAVYEELTCAQQEDRIAPRVVPRLVEAYKPHCGHPGAQRHAVQLVSSIGPSVVPVLVQMLSDAETWKRAFACRALAAMGWEAALAGACLLTLVTNDRDPTVRALAAKAVRDVGAASDEPMIPLIQALDDDDRDVRREAALTVGELAHTSPEAIDALEQMLLLESEEPVAVAACVALIRMGPAASESLRRIWRVRPDLQPTIARRLVGNPIACEVVPILIDGLKDGRPYPVRVQAADALGAIGAIARPAVGALVEAGKAEFVLTHRAGELYGSPDQQQAGELTEHAFKALGRVAAPADIPTIQDRMAEWVWDRKYDHCVVPAIDQIHRRAAPSEGVDAPS